MIPPSIFLVWLVAAFCAGVFVSYRAFVFGFDLIMRKDRANIHERMLRGMLDANPEACLRAVDRVMHELAESVDE